MSNSNTNTNKNKEKELTQEELQQIFGAPPPRKPIPSNGSNYCIQLLSRAFPDNQTFAYYASLPEYNRWIDYNNYGRPGRQISGNEQEDSILDRWEREFSGELVGPGSVDRDSLRNDVNYGVTARVPFTDDNFSGANESEKMTCTTKTMHKAGSGEEPIDTLIADVQKIPEASSVMDESDDMDVSRLPEKDLNNDFGSNLDTDVCVANTLATKTGKIRLTVERDIEEEVASEVKEKDVEVDGLAHESHVANYQGNFALDKEVCNQVQINNHYADTCFGDFQYEEPKFCNEKVTNELSEWEGPTYFGQKCSNKGALFLSSFLANSIDKGNESGISMKGKSEMAKKAPQNDVVSAIHGHISGQVETPSSTKSRFVEPLIHEKTTKKHKKGITEKSSAKKVRKGREKVRKGRDKKRKGRDKRSKCVQYTKEQLLCLQNASVSEDICGAIQEIAADVHDEGLHSVAEETREINDANKEKQSFSADDKLAKEEKMNTSISENILRTSQEISADVHDEGLLSEAEDTRVSPDKRKPSPFEGNETKEMEISDANMEKQSFSTDDDLATEEKMDSSVLKKRKRGPCSEARKERKKRQKRKKRAELNKKLGVKRLKLRPEVKPKVVPHCRHYLHGRCHEGEKCNFSHDVIPLTKSKPCCHFARNECMKGDKCPYDHELSKYPCNNYVTKGFCSRGDSCSFSHKAPPAERDEAASFAFKSDSSSHLQLDNSKSKQKLNATSLVSADSLKGNSVKQTSRPANPPKGISFFTFGKSSVEDSSKHKGGELSHQNSVLPNLAVDSSSKRSHDGTGVIEHTEPALCFSECDSGSLLPFDVSNPKQKLNAIPSLESGYVSLNSLPGLSARLTSQPANTPKGISYLSFGNSSVEDSSKHKEKLSQPNLVLLTAAEGSSSKQSDYGTDTNKGLRQGLFSQMFKIDQVSSSSGLSSVSLGGKSQATTPSPVHTGSLFGKVGTVNDTDKLKTVQPANPPKGINYFSFGNSSFEDSFKHKGELSQQNIGLPNAAVGSPSKVNDYGTDTNSELNQGLLSRRGNVSQMFEANQISSSSGLPYVSSSAKSQATIPSHVRTDSLIGEIGTVNDSDKLKSVQPANPFQGISYCSFGKFSDEDSSKHEGELSQQHSVLPNTAVAFSSKQSDHGINTNNELNQGLLNRRVNFSQMLKANQVSSSSGLAYVGLGGKSQATIPSHVHFDSSIRELGTASDSDKLETVQPELPDSSTPLGRFSAMVSAARNRSSGAGKSLSSTLAFAEKYGSAVKMTSEASSKVVDKDESASDSGFKRNEESKVSAILQFLYSGRDKDQV